MELLKKSIAISGAILLAVGGAVWISSTPTKDGTEDARERSGSAADGKKSAARRASGKRIREKDHARLGAAERKRPDFSKTREQEEVAASAEFVKVLDDLQSALDGDDWKRTAQIVQGMQDSNQWPDGMPSSLHHAAIDALKWFGSRTAPELVGYLGSADSEVNQSALDAMLEVLGDFSMSDRERGSLLLNYVKVVHDSDTLEMMMTELNDMRPTVRAETALAIYKSGNEAAVKVLDDGVDFFFSDAEGYEVTGSEGVERYLQDAERAYADDPELAADDEEIYGGDKET